MSNAVMLPVIVKVEVAGEFKGNTVSYFPTLPGTTAPGIDFEAYSARDGWITGSLGWLNAMRPATDEEAETALSELTRVLTETPGQPVQLVRCKRRSTTHQREHNAAYYGRSV
jgi:hypothetical protein